MKKTIIFFLFIATILFFCAGVSAKEAKREWQDKKFDIKSIHTILIMPTSIKGGTDDKMLSVVLNGMITDKFNDNNMNKNNIHFITLEDAYFRLKAITGEDMKDLQQRDINKYNEVWTNNISKVCDAVLASEVTSMGTEVFTYEKIVNEVIAYDEEESNSKNNNTKTKTSTITIPVQQTVTAERISAGMEFTLLNAKNLQPVWYLLDSRERVNDGTGLTSPEDMFKRITERTFDCFKSLF